MRCRRKAKAVSDDWFAQRGEDKTLRRMLGERDPVTWIDVGAYDPIDDSVTEHFSRRGGTGINVEPVPALFSSFPAARPRDINLECAVSDRAGKQVIEWFEGTGLSTSHSGNARSAREAGFKGIRLMVKTRTLVDICHEFIPFGQTIDFIKIDVEGSEPEVIRGANWHLYPARIVVVEATKPCTDIPTWAEWEPMLLAAGYRFVEDDGLNRFYRI
jgi:FkbM family methyltransferase